MCKIYDYRIYNHKLGGCMKNKFIVKLLIIFIVLILIEFFIVWLLGMDCAKMIENMIQFMILDVAGLAFYTWYEDNRRSNVELVFAFDKRWDEIIEIIDDKFCKIKKEFAEKKADNENKDYLRQLKKTQDKLKFLLEKINYYEGKYAKEKSYIDLKSVIEGINEAVTLITDIENKNTEKTKNVLDLYKNNLENIKDYISRADIYSDANEIIDNIKKIIEDINIFENVNDYTNEINHKENKTNKNDKEDCGSNVIGESIGNNRYFKPGDELNHYVFTSRNWNDENNEYYGTWYRVPRPEGGVYSGKDYYFIVREANDKNEYPYLYINKDNFKNLINIKQGEKQDKKQDRNNKSSDDNCIHFYFKWNKNGDTSKVTDERSDITLEDGTYELGKAKLENGSLIKVNN